MKKNIELPAEIGESLYKESAFPGVVQAVMVQGYSIGTMYDFNADWDDDESYGNELCIHYAGSGFTGKTPISELGKTIFKTQAEAKGFFDKQNKLQ